jgi:signal transduction histidine kinase
LYYVDQICKAHNWKWKIESTINQGTSVLFKIRHANG